MDPRNAHPGSLEDATRTALIASVVATVVLYALPYPLHYLKYPLMLLSTVVHELGHGIAMLLIGGSFDWFEMWPRGSGMAHGHGYGVGGASAFVSAGGLCGPAVASAVLALLARRPRWARVALGAFGGFLALALVLWVRGAFGIVFVGVLTAATLALVIRGSAELGQTVLVFLAMQLALSVFSRGDYLFKREAHTGAGVSSSDVQHMADALGGPYWLWGLACGAFSVAVLLAGAWLYLRPARQR